MWCDKEVQFLGFSWSENSSLSAKVTLLSHRGSFRRNSHGGVREKTAFRHPEHGHHPVQSVETKLFQQDILLCGLGDLKSRQFSHARHSLSLSISQYFPCVTWRGWPITSLLSASAETVHVEFIYLTIYKLNHSGVIGVKFGEFLLCSKSRFMGGTILNCLLSLYDAETPKLCPPDVKSWLIGKDPDSGEDRGQEEKGVTEDEMVGWHHWLNGHEFEQTQGESEGQGSLVCCNSWGHKESDTT